ncbi:MAG: SGNH/GDSL hydrolase family protein [Acidobacteriaceae bacterium]|nr:SGNH/GDSL hydrolase family protein [Acidobacteriaceae bacterium]
MAVGVTALALISEIGLRHFAGLGDPVTVTNDSSCGYILTPNQHKRRFGKWMSVNQYGMRSGPVSPNKFGGVYRILLVGDSILYGTSQVGQEQIFATLLNRELPAVTHRSLEVLNASAGGWAIANEADYIRSRGTFRSDLVVLVLNSGDLPQPRASINEGNDAPRGPYACAWCEVWARLIKPKITSVGRSQNDPGTQLRADPIQTANNLRLLDRFESTVTVAQAKMGIIFIAFRKYVPEGAQQSAPSELVAWSEHKHVPLLDLTSCQSNVPTGELTIDGVHLSAAGNRIVATAIERNWRRLDPAGT